MIHGRLLNRWRVRQLILLTISVSALVVIYLHMNNGKWIKHLLQQDNNVGMRANLPRDKIKNVENDVGEQRNLKEENNDKVVDYRKESRRNVVISSDLKEFFKPYNASKQVKPSDLKQNKPERVELATQRRFDTHNKNAKQEQITEERKRILDDTAAVNVARMPENNKLFDRHEILVRRNRTGQYETDPWLKDPSVAIEQVYNNVRRSKLANSEKTVKPIISNPPGRAMSHIVAQGVRHGVSIRTVKRIPQNLTEEVFVFEVMRESKEERHSVKDNKCVLLKSYFVESPICIHDPNEDEVISATLLKQQTWEPNLLYVAGRILTDHLDLKFLDLGCNLGVYTILAAKLGIDVVAVDPDKQNLRLLTKSLTLGGLRNKVTMLWNAVSNVHEKVILNSILGNAGGAFVEAADVTETNKANVVQTILLDDLIPFFEGHSVFIKIDIETYEWKALQGAEKFFDAVEVAYILMEWSYHREHGYGQEIIGFMFKRGFYPHINANYNTQLEKETFNAWPDNVLWIKYSNILVE